MIEMAETLWYNETNFYGAVLYNDQEEIPNEAYPDS